MLSKEFKIGLYLHGRRSVVYFVDAIVGGASSEDRGEDLEAHRQEVGPGGGGHGVCVEVVALVGAGVARAEEHLHDHTWNGSNIAL